MYNTIKGIQLTEAEKLSGLVDKSALLHYLKDARALVVDNVDSYKEAREKVYAEYNTKLEKWTQERQELLTEVLTSLDVAALVKNELEIHKEGRGYYADKLLTSSGKEVTLNARAIAMINPTLAKKIAKHNGAMPEKPKDYSSYNKPTSPVELYNKIVKLQGELDTYIAEMEKRTSDIHIAKVLKVVDLVERNLKHLNLSL